jgi:hypothetical protein
VDLLPAGEVQLFAGDHRRMAPVYARLAIFAILEAGRAEEG